MTFVLKKHTAELLLLFCFYYYKYVILPLFPTSAAAAALCIVSKTERCDDFGMRGMLPYYYYYYFTIVVIHRHTVRPHNTHVNLNLHQSTATTE